ncbi:MAG: tetratricopeptide repeat protein, partial [Phycisphaerales bacterium]
EALEIRRRVLGDEHPDTLNSINNMGSLLNAQGKLAEADPYSREALDGFRRVLGNEHPNTLLSMYNLGKTLVALQKWDEAQALCLECHERNEKRYGPDHKETTNAINLLVELYDAWHAVEPDAGHDATAAEWRAKLPPPAQPAPAADSSAAGS